MPKQKPNVSTTDEATLLSAFVVNNQKLEQLETLLAQFNIFEAVGMTRQEIRHSHFLAFLLEPAQNHGLGAAFLKQWLKSEPISVGQDYEGADIEAVAEKIEAKWEKFLDQDLPKIRAQIGAIDWSGLKFG